MNRRFPCNLLCLVVLCVFSGPAVAARYVPIEIHLNGEVILEGNASDDGEPDADEVWDALKKVNLGETEAFKKMFGEGVPDDFTIVRKRSAKKQPLPIMIDVAYGGVAETTGLHIQRMAPDSSGRVWRIDPKEVTRLFGGRLIKRSDVAGLSNPTRSE